MGRLDAYKPAISMIILQFTYAGLALFTRLTLLKGMSPRIFVVYRQAIATSVLAPFSYVSRRKSCKPCLGFDSFCWIFVASLFGVTANQNTYFEGLFLASSTVTSAMTNLIPAITFLMATIIGLERVNIQSMRSVAKIIGTIFCVVGAISMAFLRGQKLLNSEKLPTNSVFGLGNYNNWLLGCLFLFASSCFWSFWIITLVPISKSCPDHLYTSTWMLFMATIQSAMVAYFVEQDMDSWNLHSFLELSCCLYAGIGSALSFVVQAWCVSKRGPVYTAMFNPLCTVIVAILASIFLGEEMYAGSLVGGLVVIVGLYIVLWGKGKDIEEIRGSNAIMRYEETSIVIDESSEKTSCSGTDQLEEPLLSEKSTIYEK